MGRRLTSGRLEREIDKLASIPRQKLLERWEAHYKTEPPKRISTELMVRAIAYQLQARHCGGLRPALVRQLTKCTESAGGEAKRASRAPALQPGARLIREWNGVTHTVDVIDNGFEWQHERYGSLSEIAREITGARWSGPRFFGLNGRARP